MDFLEARKALLRIFEREIEEGEITSLLDDVLFGPVLTDKKEEIPQEEEQEEEALPREAVEILDYIEKQITVS